MKNEYLPPKFYTDTDMVNPKNVECDYKGCSNESVVSGYIFREENGVKTEDTYTVHACKEHMKHMDFHPYIQNLYPKIMKD
ncbi:hypothetical protein P4J09_23715 [Bacillus cereus]|nr:hypothetical protein [Bacillus cereus]